ncbi:hypothetical protein ACVIHH_003676 [Bradyrhizobium sp. USDA 4518]
MVSLWGSRYLLPASLCSPTEIVANPGVGFTVFRTIGSGSYEDYGTGRDARTQKPEPRLPGD